MFKNVFKGIPVVSTPGPVAPPDRGYLPVKQEVDNDGSIVPVGLGVNFAREFCKDLSPETLDSLFPAGLEKE